MNSLLINTLIIKDELVRKELWKNNQIHISSLDFCKHAYKTSDNIGLIQKSQLFADCAFYLQNPSSLLPVVALSPTEDDLVLDIAAAPGGKTFHLACMMKNKGQIIANDLSRTRVSKMKMLLDKYHVKNTRFISFPGQILWQNYKDQFDKVLVDAPCTMQGTDTPSTDSPKKIAKIQRSLLRSAVACTKPGGKIIYSTCTNTVEENEEVVDYVLQKEKGVIELMDVDFDSSVPKSNSPINNSKGKAISYDTKKTFRVTKTDGYEGFFIAKFRKVDNPQKAKHK
ncbi:MAG: RsmB/NOP family class I SAM-dependent RNA methyltransferase [Patescibacteria group bacterium]